MRTVLKSKEFKKLHENRRKDLVNECKSYIIDCDYITQKLLNDSDHAIMIKVGSVSIGITDGYCKEVIKLIKAQKEEAQKCIDGKPNNYE